MAEDTRLSGFSTKEKVGFVGLGVMGQPMALNLAKAGARLIVWNRTPERTDPLRNVGAVVAHSVDEVFAGSRIVILMLINETVIDAVLGRRTSGFAELVGDHVVVSMGSIAPDYSRALAADVQAAGGRYVEAPVSGSKKPAEAGELVALLGGEPDAIAEVSPLLGPMCRQVLACGPVGSGLLMKLAVNLYLDAMLAGLAEAVHFADRQGLDLHTFQAAIDSGPWPAASPASRSPNSLLATSQSKPRLPMPTPTPCSSPPKPERLGSPHHCSTSPVSSTVKPSVSTTADRT
jgi:3-hydroxyisobutyrate dehydrogenase